MLSQVQNHDRQHSISILGRPYLDAVFDAVDETLSWQWERNVSTKSISDKKLISTRNDDVITKINLDSDYLNGEIVVKFPVALISAIYLDFFYINISDLEFAIVDCAKEMTRTISNNISNQMKLVSSVNIHDTSISLVEDYFKFQNFENFQNNKTISMSTPHGELEVIIFDKLHLERV